ncbi:MAG: DUF364 domain-containing protein [Thermodesulfobacteriota bacterium]
MEGSIAGRLVERLRTKAEARRVVDVRLGLGYSTVRLDDGAAGLAYTYRDELGRGCNVFSGRRPLAGRPAQELLELLRSDSLLEASVGLAAANALANHDQPDLLPGDALDLLSIGPEDSVGMVGYFAPLLPSLEERAAEVLVFERLPIASSGGGSILPVEEAALALPDCQVALITATAIINHTLDEMLGWVKACREVVILGASTPMCPEIFSGTPVTLLSGLVIRSPEEILRVVSEGGGARHFRTGADKVNLKVKREI